MMQIYWNYWIFCKMLLISNSVFEGDFPTYKAPKGKMYFVEAILFAVTTGLSNVVAVVLDEAVEFESNTPFSLQRRIESALATVNLADDRSFFVHGINHKTKYLTFGANSISSFVYLFQVYGELVNASKKDLLSEWFRKGR